MNTISTRNTLLITAAGVAMFSASIAGAVSLCPDTFEDGTVLGWIEGNSPNIPTNIASGGPDGVDDNYLENFSNGIAGSGSKMVMFNVSSWTGDYLAAGIMAIRADVKVETTSASSLSLRVGVQASTQFGGLGYVNLTPIVVPNDGVWHEVTFPMASTDLVPVGGTLLTYSQTMSDVGHIRIFSSASAQFRGDVIEATMGIDNIQAIANYYEGWLWRPSVRSDGREEYCNAPLDIVLGDNQTWKIGGTDMSCPGRTTTNTGRVVYSPPPGKFLNCSTQPAVSAGGNLSEFIGEEIADGVGQGERRLTAIMSVPGDDNLLVAGGYEPEDGGQGYSGYLALLAKSTSDIKNARTAADLENTTWRMAFATRLVSATNVNVEVAAASIYTVDLEPGQVCTFSNSSVFAPDFTDNRDSVTAAQSDNGSNFDNRSVSGGVNGGNASNCGYSIDADKYLAMSYTLTPASNPGNPTAVNLRQVVADNDRFLVWAPATTSPVGNPNSAFIGYRAASGMVPGDIDGTYLLHIVVSEFSASGTGHSMGDPAGVEFDNVGRGKIVFDSLAPGTAPPGEGGIWYSCDAEMVSNEDDRELSGMSGDSSVTVTSNSSAVDFAFTSCDYSVEADGALRLFLTVVDAGDPDPTEVLFRGYVNDSAELFTLVNSEPTSGAVAPVDYAAARFGLGVKYTGDPSGNADGDDLTNFEEFKFPLPPPPFISCDGPFLCSLPDINGNGRADVAVVVEGGSSHVHIRDGDTGELISDIDFGSDPVTGMAAIADISGNGMPEVALAGTRPNNNVRVQVKDSETGATVNNVFYGSAFSAVDMTVLPDSDGNGADEFAVVGADGTGGVRVQARDALTDTATSTTFYGNKVPPIDVIIIPDVSTNGEPEVLMHGRVTATDQARAQARDSADGTFLRNIFFGTTYVPIQLITVDDVSGDGVADIAQLARRDDTGAVRIQVKQSDTGDIVANAFTGNSSLPITIVGIDDANGNDSPDIAMLVEEPDGTAKVIVRDGSTGDFIRNIFASSVSNPVAMVRIDDLNSNGTRELVILGDDNAGTTRVKIKDSITGTTVNEFDFP